MNLRDLDAKRITKIMVTRLGGRTRRIARDGFNEKSGQDLAYFLKKHGSAEVEWLESEKRWVSTKPGSDYVAFRVEVN